MFERGLLLFLYTETPLHAGAGESTTVDLAIQRNPTLNWPIVQAGGLKGALRNAAPGGDVPTAYQRHAVFGPDTGDRRQGEQGFTPSANDAHSGALAIGDAALLAFPVASLAGIFAWVTCRQAIRDFQRTYHFLPADGTGADPFSTNGLWTWEPDVPLATQARWVGDGLVINKGQADAQIVLQDYVFSHAGPDPKLAQFAEALATVALPAAPPSVRRKLQTDLVLVHDDTFTDLVQAGIHILTRVKIEDSSGTVGQGPWDEEVLPAETILYAPVLAGRPRADPGAAPKALSPDAVLSNATGVLDYFADSVVKRGSTGLARRFQLGGDATIGRGWIYPSTLLATKGPPTPPSSGAGQGGNA